MVLLCIINRENLPVRQAVGILFARTVPLLLLQRELRDFFFCCFSYQLQDAAVFIYSVTETSSFQKFNIARVSGGKYQLYL